MVSYLYASPSGIPGDVTRVDETNIEPVTLVSPFPSNYGLPMKYVAGADGAPTGVTPMVAADTASEFCGILTRQAPSISGNNTNEDFYTNEPNPLQIQGLCVRGYVSVYVQAGSPVRGNEVYVVQTASSGHLAGQLEVGSNGGNNVALTGTVVGNVTWAADGVDSNGFGEVRIAQ